MTWYSGSKSFSMSTPSFDFGRSIDVPDGRLHLVVPAEVLAERLRLGGRLDDDEVLGHVVSVGAARVTRQAPEALPGQLRDEPAELEREERLERAPGRERPPAGSGRRRVARPVPISVEHAALDVGERRRGGRRARGAARRSRAAAAPATVEHVLDTASPASPPRGSAGAARGATARRRARARRSTARPCSPA